MGSLSRFLSRPLEDRLLLIHAVVLHVAAAGLVRLVSPRRLIRWLGSGPRRRGAPPVRDDSARVVWAVRTAAYLVPIGTCLTVALTAQCLLRRRGADAALCIGVTRADGRAPIAAHAWLEQAGRIIIGGEDAGKYRRLPLPTEAP
jgi:hypothetical protein